MVFSIINFVNYCENYKIIQDISTQFNSLYLLHNIYTIAIGEKTPCILLFDFILQQHQLHLFCISLLDVILNRLRSKRKRFLNLSYIRIIFILDLLPHVSFWRYFVCIIKLTIEIITYSCIPIPCAEEHQLVEQHTLEYIRSMISVFLRIFKQ